MPNSISTFIKRKEKQSQQCALEMAARSAALLSAQGEAIPKALSSSCSNRARSLTSCRKLTGQVTKLKVVSSFAKPGPMPLRGMALTVTPPQSPGIPKKGPTLSRDRLWREFFSDPSQWWDNRFDKKSSRSPDFRHKITKEALWVEGWSNPPWVEAELAAMMPEQAECGEVRKLCKAGRLQEALGVLKQPGISACSETYVCLLQECIKIENLEMGQQVHAHIIQSGFKPNTFLFNTLLNMYVKCGSLGDARLVFDEMPERNVFTGTILMAGYARYGCGREAINIYDRMIREGLMPDTVTFIAVLNACASLGALEKGKEVHADIVKAGILPVMSVETALVNMYAKCGSLRDARQVFDNMAYRNVVSWNAMIAGYAQHDCGKEALEMYEEIIQSEVKPDTVTLVCVINACAKLAALEKGKEVHAGIMKAGIALDIILETTLVNMYAKCDSMEDAQQVFDNMAERDVVSWNAMIAGYAQNGCGREALEIYEQMIVKGVKPNGVTFICTLNACASLAALQKGKEIHAGIMKAGIQLDIVLETTLLDMYAKCVSMNDARQVFDKMGKRDEVSWNAMIAGYAQNGCAWDALEIYEQMMKEGVMPNRVTFISVLNACARLAALKKGQEVHSDIVKAGILLDVILGTALVNMYAKCGSVDEARHVFDNMAQRNVVSWTAMVAGYAQHGCAREALQLFEQLQQEDLPNTITFTGVLSACSHVGLVEEGQHYFGSMTRDHGLTPTVEHFGCMVDLLGWAGQLDEAEELISKMPIKPDAGVWGALLGACRIHGNVEVAERAAKWLLKWDPQDAATYVLLSNIYAAAGRWDDIAKVRKMMEDRGVRKEPGCCSIEVENQVHTFEMEENSIHKLRKSMLS